MRIVVFSMDDIGNIILKFGSSKAPCDNMISMPMLHLRDKSVCKIFNIVFKSCLTQAIF